MNKANGGDRIPAEQFKTLKDDAVKVLCSVCQQYGKLTGGHGTEKDQFSFLPPKEGNTKEFLNCCTIALISHASKEMLKIH